MCSGINYVLSSYFLMVSSKEKYFTLRSWNQIKFDKCSIFLREIICKSVNCFYQLSKNKKVVQPANDSCMTTRYCNTMTFVWVSPSKGLAASGNVARLEMSSDSQCFEALRRPTSYSASSHTAHSMDEHEDTVHFYMQPCWLLATFVSSAAAASLWLVHRVPDF